MVINGLLLSSNNYMVAKNMLVERFGDTQMLVSALMGKLLHLEVVTDISNTKELRKSYFFV